jgi:hypothetical protein
MSMELIFVIVKKLLLFPVYFLPLLRGDLSKMFNDLGINKGRNYSRHWDEIMINCDTPSFLSSPSGFGCKKPLSSQGCDLDLQLCSSINIHSAFSVSLAYTMPCAQWLESKGTCMSLSLDQCFIPCMML